MWFFKCISWKCRFENAFKYFFKSVFYRNWIFLKWIFCYCIFLTCFCQTCILTWILWSVLFNKLLCISYIPKVHFSDLAWCISYIVVNNQISWISGQAQVTRLPHLPKGASLTEESTYPQTLIQIFYLHCLFCLESVQLRSWECKCCSVLWRVGQSTE